MSQQHPSIDESQPHAPDVAERLTADQGFSRGWGEHFQPSEAYLIDCHVHMRDQAPEAIAQAVQHFYQRLDAWRLRRLIVLNGRPDNLDAFASVASHDDRFRWLVQPRHDEPDIDLLERAFNAGAVGVKLHNAAVITSGAPYDVWLSQPWTRIFERIARQRAAVLWHVTQRLTDSPYTGGDRNSYWSEGWKKGVTYRNHELLEAFLQVVRRWPQIPFIGAHQLHVGFDRLDELFAEHANLYIDTSIGCFVRWGDRMYRPDRQRARDFFTRHSHRILFGTDCGIGLEATEEYVFQAFLGHVRYLRQLRLPDPVLQAVAHGNAERLFKLEPLQVKRKGNLRP
ncbi:MAG: amidohydrolase family protein [Phycisphaerae bacterium]